MGGAINPQSPSLVIHFIHPGSTFWRFPSLPNSTAPGLQWASLWVHWSFSHSNHSRKENSRVSWGRGGEGRTEDTQRQRHTERKDLSSFLECRSACYNCTYHAVPSSEGQDLCSETTPPGSPCYVHCITVSFVEAVWPREDNTLPAGPCIWATSAVHKDPPYGRSASVNLQEDILGVVTGRHPQPGHTGQPSFLIRGWA